MAAMSAAEVVRPIPGTHATVRVEEDTGSVPRSPTGSWPSSTNGLRSSDGRLVGTARSHILADFADTRARRKPLKPLRAGTSGDSGVLVVTRVRSTTTKCTRGRGCNGHPAFPTPSLGGKYSNASGAWRGENVYVRLEFPSLRANGSQ